MDNKMKADRGNWYMTNSGDIQLLDKDFNAVRMVSARSVE